MKKIKLWFKRLLCRHDYKNTPYYVWFGEKKEHTSYYTFDSISCKKCGKKK